MNVEFRTVSAAYGAKRVLEDLSFTLESGSITALLGRNGVGKSTALRCLTGEKRDYTGGIFLDGQEVRSLTGAQRATALACLPQELPWPRVTVEELVSFGRTPYGSLLSRPGKEDREKIAWAMKAVGIASLAAALTDSLSGGERKKAFFAMTLAQDPPLLILDEPCAHLDSAARFEFLNLVEQLRQETGKTFLLVMHELPEAFRTADRVIVLEAGRKVFDGTPDGCIHAGIPERVFDVRIRGTREEGFSVLPK